VKYLANMLTAGDERPVIKALERMLAMRRFKRSQTVDGAPDHAVLEQVGLDEATVEDMYQIMAIANYEDRFRRPHRQARTVVGGCLWRAGRLRFQLRRRLPYHQHGATPTDIFGGKRASRRAFPAKVEFKVRSSTETEGQ
jgi:nitrate reductase / nitrite oxidoreductase, beta subunit